MITGEKTKFVKDFLRDPNDQQKPSYLARVRLAAFSITRRKHEKVNSRNALSRQKDYYRSSKAKAFVSAYMHPEQLAECIELVGENEILILDNGAFTAWKKGITLDAAWWDGFYAWANAAMDKCPNAVCVIPDVINGDEASNLQLIADAIKGGKIKYPERAMAIWHMNESFDQLEKLFRIFNFVTSAAAARLTLPRTNQAILTLPRSSKPGRSWITGKKVWHRQALDSHDERFGRASQNWFRQCR